MITSNTSCGSYQGVELKYEGMIVIYHLRQTPLSQHEASYLSRKYLVYATKTADAYQTLLFLIQGKILIYFRCSDKSLLLLEIRNINLYNTCIMQKINEYFKWITPTR